MKKQNKRYTNFTDEIAGTDNKKDFYYVFLVWGLSIVGILIVVEVLAQLSKFNLL